MNRPLQLLTRLRANKAKTLYLDLNSSIGFILFFCIGVYGFPSVTFSHNSLPGLMVRILGFMALLVMFFFWIFFHFNDYKSAPRRRYRFQIRLLDLIGIFYFFFTLVLIWHKELQSTITGDENALFSNSLKHSVLLASPAVNFFPFLKELPIRLLIAGIQLLLISFGIFIWRIIRTRLSSQFARPILFVIITLILYLLHTIFFGEAYHYPSASVIPYFFLAPLVLIFGLSPKLISFAVFAVFAQISFRLSSHLIRSASFRYATLTLFLSLPIVFDLSTSLNHSVYGAYVVSIALLCATRLRNPSLTIILIVSTTTIFRPTSIVPIFTIWLLTTLIPEVRTSGLKSVYARLVRERSVLLGISILPCALLINRSIAYLFGKASLSNGISSEQKFQDFLNSMSNSGYMIFILILFAFLYGVITSTWLVPASFFTNVAQFIIMAPHENLGVPIYKSEILFPFALFGLMAFVKSVETFFMTKYNALRRFFLYSLFSVTLCVRLWDAQSITVPNYSWSESYNFKAAEFYDFDFITYAKIDYSPILNNYKLFRDCLFKDNVYDGGFLLTSKITAIEFLDTRRRLLWDQSKDLQVESSNCLIVGDYPIDRFMLENAKNKLGFTLSNSFTNKSLNTTVWVFRKS